MAVLGVVMVMMIVVVVMRMTMMVLVMAVKFFPVEAGFAGPATACTAHHITSISLIRNSSPPVTCS